MTDIEAQSVFFRLQIVNILRVTRHELKCCREVSFTAPHGALPRLRSKAALRGRQGGDSQ